MAYETLFEGRENADVGVGVALALGPCAVIAKERFDAVCETGCLLPIDMDDPSRTFSVAVVDDDRELVEAVGVTVSRELSPISLPPSSTDSLRHFGRGGPYFTDSFGFVSKQRRMAV